MAIVNQSVPSGGRVFDVACGPGALSQRLDTEGFSVIAADRFPEVFRLHGKIPFVELDVEKEWGGIEGGFDAICAVAMIEHLENPYLFVRKCFEALKPGGILIIAAPNATHYVSRVMFLFSGVFELFSPRTFASETRTTRGALLPPHINLSTNWMVRENLKRGGFEDIVISSCTNWLSGLTPIPLRPLNLLRWGFYRFIGTLVSPFMCLRDNLFSEMIVAVASKPRV